MLENVVCVEVSWINLNSYNGLSGSLKLNLFCLYRFSEAHNTLHPEPCTQHPAPRTLHAAPWTLNPARSTLNPEPCTQHPAPCTLHSALCTLHTTFCTLHPALCTHHPEPCILHHAPCTTHCRFDGCSSATQLQDIVSVPVFDSLNYLRFKLHNFKLRQLEKAILLFSALYMSASLQAKLKLDNGWLVIRCV